MGGAVRADRLRQGHLRTVLPVLPEPQRKALQLRALLRQPQLPAERRPGRAGLDQGRQDVRKSGRPELRGDRGGPDLPAAIRAVKVWLGWQARAWLPELRAAVTNSECEQYLRS